MKADFQNTYSKLPENFYERIKPEFFEKPKLLLWNHDLAAELGFAGENFCEQEAAKIFSGQKILAGSEPMATAYAGHQFAHPVPELGDGRAHLLGEINGLDLQLKGSGRSRYSRRGDGRSALGPVIREYIVSEAMFYLGIPTTRSLAAVASGENVLRQDGPEPGGILTRVASSHIRVGTFQYFFFKKDFESLKILLDYTINRHYQELNSIENYSDRVLAFLKQLIERQADLISKWMGLGFIHGVMNTDNFSVAGITLDYGPCAFMDEFKFHKVFSSIDRRSRYSFFNQVEIAKWNILRLVESLLPFIDESEDRALKIVEEKVVDKFTLFHTKLVEVFSKKLGLKKENKESVFMFLNYLEKQELDFTLAFRNLPELYYGQSEYYPETEDLISFVLKWKSSEIENIDSLKKVNPLYIARNHQIQRAIDAAYDGDLGVVKELLELLKSPFTKNEKFDFYKTPPTPEERVPKTFCGT